jgi:phosphoglycerate dehydrogenase-like enzyme
MDEKIDVLITLGISEELLGRLQAVSPRLYIHIHKANRPEDIPADVWATAEVLYTGRILPQPTQAPNLRWIQFHFAGVDHAKDYPILQREGLISTTISGASATQVAEYIIMMMLMLGHRAPEMMDHQKKQIWPKDRWERFSPFELRDAAVGIVGYGSIGRQLARLLNAFGTRVFATKRDAMQPKDEGYTIDGFGDPGGDYIHRLYPAEAIRSMAKISDYLVITVPLSPGTRNLIDADVFDVMKETAFIIDTSRGGVINHAALNNALKDRKIAGAALDVFSEEPLPVEDPLWKMPNVILTPHISGISPHYDERAMQMFSENLRRYLSGEDLLNVVNLQRGY